MEKPAGHAFISYVREDSHDVDRLQRTLEAAGVSVWRDTADLWPGENWRVKIRRAITDNTLVFIACFSTRSVARVKSYQNEELLLAVEQLRLRRPDDPWLIPVRFDDCDIPDLELGGGRTLASIQRADFFGNSRDVGAARLVAAVLRLPGRRIPGDIREKQAHAEPDAYVASGPAARQAAFEERRAAGAARRAAREARETPSLFSVASQGPQGSQDGNAETSAEAWASDLLRKKPLVVSGQHSKVLELNLLRGGYRMNWTTEGNGTFTVHHESGKYGMASLVSESVPGPNHGEVLVRIEETGRHIFSVIAMKLTWELTFTLL